MIMIRLGLGAIYLLTSIVASAQPPQITTVWPPGGMIGSRVSARIEGERLGGATSVLVSGKDVTAQIGSPTQDGKILPLDLQIRSDASPGPYEVRVVSPKGVSNPGYVWIGTLPEVPETEPNEAPPQATKLAKLPITIYGRIDKPEDMDWYAFHAASGETIVVDICAFRIYSPLDPVIELRDSSQNLLASVMEGYDRDPRLIYTFKKTGEYRLLMRDTMYRGGTPYVYRLTLGKLPVITTMNPMTGRRGETFHAAVEGVNLGGMKTLTLTLPKDMPLDRPWYFVPQTPNGPALPVCVMADDNPLFLKSDTNSRNRPDRVPALPVTIYGCITTAKMVDYYVIPVKANKPLTLRVFAREAGSRLYPLVRILDRTGKEIINSEEQVGHDPVITFTPSENDTYRLEIRSVDGRFGSDYFYRITISAPDTKDFQLTATPDILNLGRGQTGIVTITARRFGGFEGPIKVKLAHLPEGVVASPLTLAPGKSEGILTLTSSVDSAHVTTTLSFVGEAVLEGQDAILRAAIPLGDLPRPGEGKNALRPVSFQMLSVTDEIPLYRLSLDRSEVTLTPGQAVELQVTATRKAEDKGAEGAIGLEIRYLPPGVTAELPAIPEKGNAVKIKLRAADDAKPNTGYALLNGRLRENIQYAPVLLVTVNAK
jgi:hypothetical protein